jgi:hypothetical protein
MAFRSASAVVIGPMLKFSTRKLSTFGVMKPAVKGDLDVLDAQVQQLSAWMITAFCSYQESTSDSGRSLTPT